MTYLAVDSLSATIGASVVLDAVTIEVGRHEIVAVAGRNGAGKSSLLRAVAGFAPCSAKSMTMRRRSLMGMPPERRARLGLGYVSHGAQPFSSSTVRQNLLLGGWPSRNRHVESVLDVLPSLEHDLEASAGSLGRLERQICAIGMALMGSPTVLMLDEPAAGLAPAEAAELFAMLPDIVATGVSVALADHDPDRALSVADRAYVLEAGKVVSQGSAMDVFSDPIFSELFGRHQ